ncbi:MAG TPA: immunoglobulin domain-containing protein [Verrucomicrobiae bacterium]|nr:immunoglobulin domain-containing protein [Verrucomicrobiae bacterium]
MKTLASFLRKAGFLVAILSAVSTAHSFPIITSVVETGGDNEATDTIVAKWSGTSFTVSIANEPVPGAVVGSTYNVGFFASHAPTFVDRNHRYTNASPAVMPPYLAGGEYIMSGNDNRDNAGYILDVTVSGGVRVYMLIDNRLQDTSAATPPTFDATHMQWILDEAWEPVMTGLNRTANATVPDEVAVDEGADGTINQWYSLYSKLYPAGTFRLKQADNAGQNMYGVVVVPAEIPATPANVRAVSGDGRVTLDWSASGGTYIVKRSLTPGGPYDILATNLTTIYVDTAVVNGTTYYYVVSAFNGLGESSNSTEVIGTPKAAPTGVTAVGGLNQVTVQWDAFPGAVSYVVGRSDVSGGPYSPVGSGIAGLSFTDPGLNSGRFYYYVVTAQLAAGQSGQSSEAAGLTIPGAPALSISLFAATSFKLTWTTTDPVITTFAVDESLDGSTFQEIAQVPAATRFYVAGGVFPSETRTYRVRALNASGASPNSNLAAFTAPALGYNVNFANALTGTPPNDPAPTPAGYLQDIGEIYGLRPNGSSYGWERDIGVDSRWRKDARSPDLRYDTFNHFQKAAPAIWEFEIPNGYYSVHIVSGDPTATDSVFQHDIEGIVTAAKVPTGTSLWHEFTNNIIVSDGRLTITTGPAAANSKINFVDIYPAVAEPIVLGAQPASQVVEENRPVSFSVSVSSGSSPFSYQWYRNGQPVGGSATYTESTTGSFSIRYPQLTDAGDYTVVVKNFAGEVTSGVATLTVLDDTTAPVMVTVASLDGSTIGICYSEEMSNANQALGDAFTYNIRTPGGDPGGLSPLTVTVRPDNRTVQLKLAEVLSGEFWVTLTTDALDVSGNSVVIGQAATNVVGGFTTGDVGGPGLTGSHFTCDNETIEIVGGGADIWDTTDRGYFATKPMQGDFDASVRVVELKGSNAITKAVLVAREDNSTGARALHVSVNPPPPGRNQIELGARTTTGGPTAAWGSSFVPAGIPDAWMRIVRQGNVFTGYRSADGENWILMGTTTLALPETIVVGLGVTAHDNTQLSTGVFTDFSVTPVVTLSNPAFDGTTFSAGVKTISGGSYRVEYKDDLGSSSWNLLTTFAGDGTIQTFTDTNPVSLTGARVYRVVLE